MFHWSNKYITSYYWWIQIGFVVQWIVNSSNFDNTGIELVEFQDDIERSFKILLTSSFRSNRRMLRCVLAFCVDSGVQHFVRLYVGALGPLYIYHNMSINSLY